MPDCVARVALEAWLDARASCALRVVAAQPGGGKTTGVACWARRDEERVAWIALPQGATRSEFCALLLCALGSRETLSLAHALRSTAKRTIVIDNADVADAEARALLAELPAQAPRGLSFVYLVRDADAIDARRFPAAGVALAPSDVLRFDGAELARLCAARSLAVSLAEGRRLLAATGGWAIAAAGTVRYAAAYGGSVDAAFQRWLTTSRPFLDGLIAESLNVAPEGLAAAFHRAVTGQLPAGDPMFATLEAAGLFVEDYDGVLRVNPVVAAFERREERRARLAPALLHVFGRFRMTIGEREVLFARRRDRQLMQFLALRPSHAATRTEILDAFWPETDPHVAAQALRSACATIRRAIAECVGRANVGAYFAVDARSVRLDAEQVASTEQRFRSHVALATAAEHEAMLDAAYAHWSAALTIHCAPLLAGEPPAAWIVPAQAALNELARHAVERVRSLAYVELLETGTRLLA
jgi:hypothetical protein